MNPTEQLLPEMARRRARRALLDRPIARQTISLLLEAAHLAPSCSNNQPWRWIVIDEPGLLASLKEHLTGGNYWAAPSPAILALASAVTSDCRIPDGREYFLFGCGLSAMNLMVQAAHLGIVAHPIAGFRQAPLKQLLKIPADHTLIALIVLGYPRGDVQGLSEKHAAEERGPRVRRPLSEVAFWNGYDISDALRPHGASGSADAPGRNSSPASI